MELNIKTSIDGYFSYNIYRNSPDNIVYKSPTYKNLILNSGLSYVKDNSISSAISYVDFGISTTAPTASGTGVLDSNFSGSSMFTNVLALSNTSTTSSRKTVYNSFFRTRTAGKTTTLKEFAIKPGSLVDAFSRQLLDITLERGDGIEFNYIVEVNWPQTESKFNTILTYSTGNSGAITTGTLSVPVTATHMHIPTTGRVVQSSYYVYTLSGMDINMPTRYMYSTSTADNSYAMSSRTFIYPNTAIDIVRFSPTSGYGPIKSFMMCKELTTVNPASSNNAWNIIWNVPIPLGSLSAVTGPVSAMYGVDTEEGTLYKPYNDVGATNNLLELHFTHTWGPYRG